MTTNPGHLTTFCAKTLAGLENAQRASTNTYDGTHDQSGARPESHGLEALEKDPYLEITREPHECGTAELAPPIGVPTRTPEGPLRRSYSDESGA